MHRIKKGLNSLFDRVSTRYHRVTVRPRWRKYLPIQDLIILKRLGLEPIGVIEVLVQSLFLQHHIDRPIEFLLRSEDGKIDRSILNSPHYKLLKIYETHGIDWLRKNFRDTGYYQIYAYYNRIGKKRNLYKKDGWLPVQYEDEGIWLKILNFIDIYERVKKEGYLSSAYKDKRISVLEVPFSVGRFGAEIDWEPYEIWGGHHRAAAIAATGREKIEAILIKDTKAK